jgi:hypothetical protein
VPRGVEGADAIVHLATRIPPAERRGERAAWEPNEQPARGGLGGFSVMRPLASVAQVYVQPTVTALYAAAERVDESTALERSLITSAPLWSRRRRLPASRRRADAASSFGWDCSMAPEQGSINPISEPYGGVLHVEDAGAALLATLSAPTGVYNVVADRGRATGWAPRFDP